MALAVVLNQIQFFRLPQGGSITLGTSLPIWIVAWRHGVRVGMLAGMVLGTVLAIMAPSHVSILQVLLDYPLAFGMLGLAGLGKSWALGVLVAAGARISCHALAGILFFGQFVPQGWVPWRFAFGYNALLVLPETVLGVGLYMMLLHKLGTGSSRHLGIERSGKEPSIGPGFVLLTFLTLAFAALQVVWVHGKGAR